MIKSGGWKSVVELPDEVIRSLEGKTIRKVEVGSTTSPMTIIFEDGSVLSMMSLTMRYGDQLVKTLAEGTLTPMKYTLEEE